MFSRKPKYTRIFQLRIDSEDKQRIDEVAKAARRTKSDIVRYLVFEAWKRLQAKQRRDIEDAALRAQTVTPAQPAERVQTLSDFAS